MGKYQLGSKRPYKINVDIWLQHASIREWNSLKPLVQRCFSSKHRPKTHNRSPLKLEIIFRNPKTATGNNFDDGTKYDFQRGNSSFVAGIYTIGYQ